MLPHATMPKPDWLGTVVGTALIIAERRSPGFVEELRSEMENDALFATVEQLRGERLSPDLRKAVQEGSAWIGQMCLIVEKHAPRRRRGWW